VNPRVGVAVFIIKDGKFLMGQRQGSHGTGTWSVPGGWLEYQESFEDGAMREVKEETNIDITNLSFAAITNNVFKGEAVHSISIWIFSDWKAGEPTITEPDKFTEQRWVDFDSLPSPLFLAFEELLKGEFVEAIKERLVS
jgi:8-oxo-dGTP diphosphatase